MLKQCLRFIPLSGACSEFKTNSDNMPFYEYHEIRLLGSPQTSRFSDVLWGLEPGIDSSRRSNCSLLQSVRTIPVAHLVSCPQGDGSFYVDKAIAV
jgi:hypothetical protein